MTNLEIIRQACIASNPSILDLKFGCRVVCNNEKSATFICSSNVRDTVIFDGDNSTVDFYRENKNNRKWKILGREIRLSDVLLALDKIEPKNWGGYNPKEFTNPKLYVAKMVLKLIELWDLKNDNLELQSESTKKFIADLLI